MSKDERLQKRRIRRRKNKAIEKEEQFMLDYVRHKYSTVYEEAAWVCKQLSNKYPEKHDLRKAPEHKVWVLNDGTTPHPIFNGVLPLVSPQTATILASPQMVTTLASPQMATTLASPQTATILASPQMVTTLASPQMATTLASPQTATTLASPQTATILASPQTATILASPQMVTTLASPQMATTLASPQTATTLASPQTATTLASPQTATILASPQMVTTLASPQLATAPASSEPPSPEPPSPEPLSPPKPPSKGKLPYSDNMQLIIPLLKPPVKHVGLITETLEIVTEENLQGDEQPFLEQIDPQMMEKIIDELRADPDLKDIFSEVEQQFEELGMDIDIELDMDTRLEDELNWEFW